MRIRIPIAEVGLFVVAFILLIDACYYVQLIRQQQIDDLRFKEWDLKQRELNRRVYFVSD